MSPVKEKEGKKCWAPSTKQLSPQAFDDILSQVVQVLACMTAPAACLTCCRQSLGLRASPS